MNIIHKLRRARWIWLTRRKLSKQLKKLATNRQPIYLNIGSGNLAYNGWISLNLPFFDLRDARLWKLIIGNSGFDKILLEHVLEHLTELEVEQALSFARKYAKKNATVRIAVPDRNHPNPAYIEYVRPGGSGAGADDHKSFWNFEMLAELSLKTGFRAHPIEYYSPSGELKLDDLDEHNGVIKRTARNSAKQEIDDYSSLIVDLRV